MLSSKTSPRTPRSSTFILSRSIAVLLLAGSGSTAFGQALWEGDTSADWNDPANWSTNTVPVAPTDAVINIVGGATAPFTATISANIPTPRDILVGNAAGTTGRVLQTAGTATTGQNNWARIGLNTGTGIYDLSGGLLNTIAIEGATGRVNVGEANSIGTMNVTGSGSISTYRIYVGTGANSNGTLNINTTGTLTLTNDLFVGENGTGAVGQVTLTAGTINRTGGWTVIGGSGAGGTGTFTQTGGTVTASGDNIVGLAANSNGTFNLSGGSYTAGGVFQVGRGGGTGTALINGAGATLTSAGEIHVGNNGGSTGSMTVDAGTVSSGSWIGVGRDGSTGTLTINGGVVQQTGPVIGEANAGTLELTNFNVGGTGTVNLNGGSLIVNRVDKQGGANGTATFNFNGGRLAARANDVDFMEGLNVASVQAGGAIIDSQAFNITVSQNLVAGSASGGLTKLGSGTLTLEGTNTYTGPTSVTGGSLVVSGLSATLGSGNVSVLSSAVTLSISTGVADAIANTAVLSLAGGGTAGVADSGFLTLGGGVLETVGGLVLNNVPQAIGTYGATGSGATFINDEFFSGAGVLNVVPEPSVAISLLGGLGLLMARRRRG
jgi:fibronectin-binding autotransporter adhesin